MFTTPHKQTSSSTFGTPSKIMSTKKGLFQDGIWLCNCSPRLPAAHFQVKKDGRNRGKWFYTCQESKESGCGFFLWDENAKDREKGVLLSNARSEQELQRTTADAARDKRTIEGHAAASNKWMADLAKKEKEQFGDADEFGEWELSPEEEKRLVTAAEIAPETPSKVNRTTEFLTPGIKRKRDEESLPTPMTGARSGWKVGTGTGRSDEEVFHTPSSRLKGGMWDGNERPGLRSPSSTPTPSQTVVAFNSQNLNRNESQNQNQNQVQPQSYDITDSVLEILKDQNIDRETSAELKQFLDRHSLQISGIAKGRDITRVALKAKDGKISELKQRINELEREREMDRNVIMHFKRDMTESVERRKRGGRGGRGRGKEG